MLAGTRPEALERRMGTNPERVKIQNGQQKKQAAPGREFCHLNLERRCRIISTLLIRLIRSGSYVSKTTQQIKKI